MGNRLLRNIAVTIGAGLATGFSIATASRRPRGSASHNLNPVLSRIEEIESRVARVELAPAPVIPSHEEIEALGTLVSSQSEDIAALRLSIERLEARNASQAEAFAQKLARVEQQVPSHIDAAVNARISELEHKLRGEFDEIHLRTVDAFTQAIERGVVGRIATLEASLVEQSHSIAGLREKTLKTDDNLQRLLEAVERLCTRAEAQAQIAGAKPAQPAAAEHLPLHPPQHSPQHPPEPLAERPNERPSAAEPEKRYASPRPLHSSSTTARTMRAAGVAVLGLALVGLRIFRA